MSVGNEGLPRMRWAASSQGFFWTKSPEGPLAPPWSLSTRLKSERGSVHGHAGETQMNLKATGRSFKEGAEQLGDNLKSQWKKWGRTDPPRNPPQAHKALKDQLRDSGKKASLGQNGFAPPKPMRNSPYLSSCSGGCPRS